ncbi:Protein PHLOEM PROTEIN 2-LIKE A1 [Morella rubra]|uniref:Protein PHLOEM PROTEIN 2-LIKE A1 n=1 Tax=Morella rubra TaxID=262757 RepID=A0A6A1WSA3_9ROSI|nr:Protein PHLOEM PROTEIN 2-LIKE A1 [Morella rubra]
MEKKGANDLGNNAMSEGFLEPTRRRNGLIRRMAILASSCMQGHFISVGKKHQITGHGIGSRKQVRLTDDASGWKYPITLQLSLPDRTVQQRQVSLSEKPRKQWIELNVGSFKSTKEPGEVGFDIQGWHGGLWKNGLIISRAILRPKQMTL